MSQKELEAEGQPSPRVGETAGNWRRHVVGVLASLTVIGSFVLLVVLRPSSRITMTILAIAFFVGFTAAVIAWVPRLTSWRPWTRLAGAVAAAMGASGLLLALLQVLPVDEKSSELGDACRTLAAKAGNESDKLGDLQNSIHTKKGHVSAYNDNFETALADAFSAVDESDDALAAFIQMGGRLPTDEEEQRKFPEDFNVIRTDLEILSQKRIDENSDKAWNQLHDYASDSSAIAKIVCPV
jgi:hypothetical protein